jgi:hypothetical protein
LRWPRGGRSRARSEPFTHTPSADADLPDEGEEESLAAARTPFKLFPLGDKDELWAVLEDEIRRYDRDESGALDEREAPLVQCLNVARDNRASTAVIEVDYFDRDYLSEFSALHALTFQKFPDRTQRIHFFGSELKEERLWQLTESEKASYLGYIIERPVVGSSIGRTMLHPNIDLDTIVHTAVEDVVHFFGQRLRVQAVPFMQQDSRLLTCSHVASWVCHYSAVLRGVGVARRAVADFSLQANPSLSEGRPLPSTGLNRYQITDLLRAFGLPPLFYDVASLTKDDDRSPDWKDATSSLHSRIARICCRYVNSGLPVIAILRNVSDSRQVHAVVVCGYERSHPKGLSGRTSLLVQDDEAGPYFWVHQIDPEARDDRSYEWVHLIAPLPPDLWLSGEAAERRGSQVLVTAAQLAIDPPENEGLEPVEGPEILLNPERQAAAEGVTLRTYALTSNQFKRRFARNSPDPDAVQEYMYLKMPRWVWIVEAGLRARREAGKDYVVAEVVLDGTSDDDESFVLATRLPGVMSVRSPDGFSSGGPVGKDPMPSCGRRPGDGSI